MSTDARGAVGAAETPLEIRARFAASATIDVGLGAIQDAIITGRDGATAADAAITHAVAIAAAGRARATRLAVFATIDVRLVAISNAIEAGGGCDAASRLGVARLLVAISVSITEASDVAARTGSPTIEICLVAVPHLVVAAWGETHQACAPETADFAGAVACDSTAGAISTLSARGSPAVGVRLFAIGDAVVTGGGYTDIAYAVTAGAVTDVGAGRARVAGLAIPAAIHVGLATILLTVVAARGGRTPFIWSAIFRCAVFIEGAATPHGAAFAAETAAIEACLVSIEDVVVAARGLTDPAIASKFAHAADAVVCFGAAQVIGAGRTRTTTVHVRFVLIGNPVLAGRLGTLVADTETTDAVCADAARGARTTGGARAATVDVRLATVAETIVASGRGNAAASVRIAGVAFAVVARLAPGANLAPAAAVSTAILIGFIAIGDAVVACCASAFSRTTDAAFAVCACPARCAGAAAWAIAAAVASGLRPVLYAIVAGCLEAARRIGVTATVQTVVVQTALRICATGCTGAPAIDVRLVSVILAVIAGWGGTADPVLQVAVFTHTVRVAATACASRAAIALFAATVDVGLLPVSEAIVTGGPGAETGVAESALAISIRVAARAVSAARTIGTAVHIGLFSVFHAVVAAGRSALSAIAHAALAIGGDVAKATVAAGGAIASTVGPGLCAVEDAIVAAGRCADAVGADGTLAIFGTEAARVSPTPVA